MDAIGKQLGVQLRARLCRSRLDRELAACCSPQGSDVHALRARQLSEMPARAEVAASLRRVVNDAALPYSVLNAVPLRHTEVLLALRQFDVLAWREGLLGMADRLQADGPVNPRGVARARVLLTDASGPLYNPDSPRSLGEMIWWIADGLEPRPRIEPRHSEVSSAW